MKLVSILFRRPSIALVSAAGLLAWCAATQAQSLGDELILSRLGDPVEVEIAVEDWQGLDLAQFRVHNGDAGQYALFGLEYQDILDSLDFALIGPNLRGEVKVLISSREPVSEPFLELLLVLSWPSGSTLRDYVLLFDPPRVAPDVSLGAVPEPVPQPVVQQPVVLQQPEVANAPAPLPSPASGEPDVRTQVAIAVDDVADDTVATPVPATDALDITRRQYEVRNGDTLWIIARQFQPAGATENLYQFLVSLHDLNRSAFINGNISLLQSGANLFIPTVRDVSSINPATAQTVFEQRWAEGTMIATGTAGAPPAEFATLNDAEADEVPAPEAASPQQAPGTEIPLQQENSGLSTTVTTAVTPAGIDNVAVIESAIVVSDAEGTLATDDAGQSLLAPTTNPYLRQVNDSAIEIRRLLEARQQRMAQVEEQLLAMRVQMQEAQNAARELNAKLQAAVAIREKRQAENLRDMALLGTLVAGLLLALLLALWKLRLLHGQVRRLARIDETSKRQYANLPQKAGVLPAEQAEVTEIEEITLDEPAQARAEDDELTRDRDKVPDIHIPLQEEVDYHAVEPPSDDSESAPAPKTVVQG